ncbi:16697_t:CDS:1, partial [Rhizophagus irregularis]
MSVNCCLNGKNFAITVLNDEQTHNPCFRCICDGKDSGTQLTATAAINNTYSQIFSNKTKYSGLAVMGFDNEAIVHELVADISFIPIFIRLDQILIVVSKIGVSSREGCYGAGPGYLSTLITKYADKRSLFVQSIEDECSLDIYNEGIKLYHNKDTTPNKIWETIGILKKYDGATLFGITDYNIQQILTELNKLEK